MNPQVLIPPDANLQVVTTATLKLHLRRDEEYTAEDSLFADLLAEASEWVERETGQQMLTATKRFYLDRFPTGAASAGLGLGPDGGSLAVPLATMTGFVINQRAARTIELPTPPLQSVTSVNYLVNSTPTVLSPAVYTVDAANRPGRVVLNGGQSWPITDDVANAVWIDFVCGYGSAASAPRAFSQAIKWLCGHCYENREAVSDKSLSELPIGLRAVIESLMFREACSA